MCGLALCDDDDDDDDGNDEDDDGGGDNKHSEHISVFAKTCCFVFVVFLL